MNTFRIGLVSNGLSNLGSVESALAFYGYDVARVENARQLDDVACIVLAGVGHFGTAVARLQERGMWDALQFQCMEKRKPTLGLCLGMQLFFERSAEAETALKGFGWLSGEVAQLPATQGRVPHIGWSGVEPREHWFQEAFFRGLRHRQFYYMHSYHCVPTDPGVICARTAFGPTEFVAAVAWRNFVGVQFHPEKSQGDGLRLLNNIIEQFRREERG